MLTGSSALSKPEISKKRCAQPARLATTGSNTGRAVTWCPIHLRTAPLNNASAGSAAAMTPAISDRATPLTRLICECGTICKELNGADGDQRQITQSRGSFLLHSYPLTSGSALQLSEIKFCIDAIRPLFGPI